MTYGVWDLALPIPLRVQFSDKQKHIQALASHFTLCALAGGDAFLEPLAYSPKNGSSWLSFKKQKRKTGGWWWWGEGGVGAGGRVGGCHIWRIRLHLSSCTLSALCSPSDSTAISAPGEVVDQHGGQTTHLYILIKKTHPVYTLLTSNFLFSVL